MKFHAFLLLILAPLTLLGQTGIVSGKLMDEKKQPLAFATVVVFQGKTVVRGTNTDASGSFAIKELEPGVYTVEFRYVGRENVSREVHIVAKQTRQLEVYMKEGMRTDCSLYIGSHTRIPLRAGSGATYTGLDVRRSAVGQ